MAKTNSDLGNNEIAKLNFSSSDKLINKNIPYQSTSCKTKESQQSFKFFNSNSRFVCENQDCGELLYLDEIRKHSDECEFSQKNFKNLKGRCEFCNQVVEDPKVKHLHVTYLRPSECDSFYTKCPNCKLNNVKIKEHFNVCPMKPKECNLKELGCKGMIIADVVECTKANGHEKLLDNLMKTISQQIKNIDITDVKPNFDITAITQEISILKEVVKKNKTLYQTPRNGKLVWIIDKAPDFLQEMKPRFSTPVYTSDHGYKLCLKAYPKGEGSGKDSHFSLFFFIMKGEYDDLLSWPFKYKVKITLYNKDVHSKSKHEIYKCDDNSTFHQPVSNFNTPTGNPRFIELQILKDKDKGFIIDNCLFIELYVEKRKTYL